MSTRKEDPQLSEISERLDTLIRFFALNLVRDVKTQKEQIAMLSDAGFRPKQIAGIIGATENTVNVTLHSIRRERSAKEIEEASTTVEPTGVSNVKETEKTAGKTRTNDSSLLHAIRH